MNKPIKKFPKHACQYCGAEEKVIEVLTYDRFMWDEGGKCYEPNKPTGDLETTGKEWCFGCGKKWTGDG